VPWGKPYPLRPPTRTVRWQPRKRGVGVGHHRHEAPVESNVVDAARDGLARLFVNNVIGVHLARALGWAPLRARVLVGADELFLFCADRDHRLARAQVAADLFVYVAELGVRSGCWAPSSTLALDWRE
jgi:hypothetical protein